MTGYGLDAAASTRAYEVSRRLRRHNLVFIQCGAVYSALRSLLISKIGGITLSVDELLQCDPVEVKIEHGKVVVTDLENYASYAGATLGAIRARVGEFLDASVEVCLFSRTPRISYPQVPGSSLLDDASVCRIPLLDEAEQGEMSGIPGSCFPSFFFGEYRDLRSLFSDALRDLGLNALAALDEAVFDKPEDLSFIDHLDPRERDALLGAGLLVSDGESSRLPVPARLVVFREALADVIAQQIAPQTDLAEVVGYLWVIERIIRRALRARAVESLGGTWRKQILNGNLGNEIVNRACKSGAVSVNKVGQLRDPIEWLTLTELLDIVTSKKFGGLAIKAAQWNIFTQDVVPIRNRVSHMRLVKKGDLATVQMWKSIISNKLISGASE